eukprot:GFUD01012733.1.p1 GENE.GFUD01012733.1~~GFUD01012733.1.p1  ORF type:complete len:340 (+),score=85.19 GFUD01012733.1:237-1256(+)
MDFKTNTNFLENFEQIVGDDSFSDILGNFDTFSDSHSESDWSDIGILDNIQDMIFDTNNEANLNTHNNNDTESFKSRYLYTLESSKTSTHTSPFDTNNFPTSVNDISNLIEIEPNFKCEDSQCWYMSDPNSLDVSYNVTVPVIKVEEIVTDKTVKEDKEDEDEISVDEHLLQPSKRRHQRKYSSTDDTESDEEWAPTPVKCFRKNQTSTRRISVSKTPSLRPVPQRRSPGTKLKITQWIVELLRDPKYNPKVITWVDEKRGVFLIKDTAAYAKLWGKIKQNTNMTYEKLSRAMRYSYKNDELRMVPEQRLTYKFGPNMVNFRAEDPEDPNLKLVHRKLS